MSGAPGANRLAAETSPYLQQHAGNPVDWYPWGEEALAAARESDRPILLSVGYSACHWCHVMAHECFEDDETAALMNRWFVNVKVDREERPDIDQVYQTAHQLIAQGPGGWPLTMFLTPDGRPFYGGTYFPKRSKYGRPGFDQLLSRIAELWSTDRADLVKNGDAVVSALKTTIPRAAEDAASVDLDALTTAARRAFVDDMLAAFDARHGGFGRAPKFPQPSVLSALLREAVSQGNDRARDAVLLTLRRMAEGGLYDHLGGGFCRYSTDERWLIPHFEKMLYDNGPLLRLYAEAFQLSRDPFFREVCEGTAAWMIAEMQSTEGGYYSSLDADSEGEEGRFYVWDRDAVAAELTADEFAVFSLRYGLDGPPNFEGHAWHLHVARSVADVARSAARDEASVMALLASARTRLLALRGARVRPARDDKVLSSWNALAIDGMFFASRVFGREDWARSATRALAFIRTTLWRDDRLLATYKDGRAHLNAYLDDHAFLLGALLEAMQHGPLDPALVDWASRVAGRIVDGFEDRDGGGFFFTSHDHEALVVRPKPGYDNATPSGNGSAALQLQRFGHLVGDLRCIESAERAMVLFAPQVARVAQAFATLLVSMAERILPAPVVVVAGGGASADDEAGNGDPADARAWRSSLAQRYEPGLVAVVVPAGSDRNGLPGTLARPRGDGVRAWVCRGAQCLPPISDPTLLDAALGASTGMAGGD